MSEAFAAEIADLKRRIKELEGRESAEYSTGTYTPTYLGGTTAGTTTYTTQAGFYVRIGKVVFFTATVVWTAATGTGNAQVSLPFTAENGTNEAWSAYARSINVTFANGSIEGQITGNTNFVFFLSPATNAAGTNVAVEAAGNLIVSGFYFVA